MGFKASVRSRCQRPWPCATAARQNATHQAGTAALRLSGLRVKVWPCRPSSSSVDVLSPQSYVYVFSK